MKGYDSRFIDELKNKNDLLEIVSKYVSLSPRGGNYWGRCPFHHEKTPSFTVNQREQFYYCFGCHKSGDVISFIMEMESLDFADAVKFLADRVGLKLPEIKIDDEKLKEQKQKKETLLSILKDAAKFYCFNFRSGRAKKHIDYAISRNLSDKTLTVFGIGASLDYDGVIDYLQEKGYSLENIYESGVAGKSEKNGKVHYYDALSGRLIIPVIDQMGNVVAFCGRIIEKKENVGKYVNTRETSVFSKGKTLFNLNNLKKLKNQEGIDGVIIVEGHMDVISMVQAGISNVVASMGTALTKDQARILKRYSDKVFISYDGDFAGQKASIRGLEILKEEGLDVKVVVLPDGLDPDDVIKKFGKEGYLELLNNAMPLIDFKLDILKKTFDISTVDGKRKFTSNAIKVIKESQSPAEQEDLLKNLRDITGTTYESLKRELLSIQENHEDKPIVTPELVGETGNKAEIASRFILYAYLFSKDYVVDTDINSFEFDFPVHQFIQKYISDRTKNNEAVRFSDLYEFTGEEYRDEITKIASIETADNKTYDEASYFADCIKTVKVCALERKINKLTSLSQRETDNEKRKELVIQISKLIKEKKDII